MIILPGFDSLQAHHLPHIHLKQPHHSQVRERVVWDFDSLGTVPILCLVKLVILTFRRSRVFCDEVRITRTVVRVASMVHGMAILFPTDGSHVREANVSDMSVETKQGRSLYLTRQKAHLSRSLDPVHDHLPYPFGGEHVRNTDVYQHCWDHRADLSLCGLSMVGSICCSIGPQSLGADGQTCGA